jgi:hypothetical protein
MNVKAMVDSTTLAMTVIAIIRPAFVHTDEMPLGFQFEGAPLGHLLALGDAELRML